MKKKNGEMWQERILAGRGSPYPYSRWTFYSHRLRMDVPRLRWWPLLAAGAVSGIWLSANIVILGMLAMGVPGNNAQGHPWFNLPITWLVAALH